MMQHSLIFIEMPDVGGRLVIAPVNAVVVFRILQYALFIRIERKRTQRQAGQEEWQERLR